MPIQKSTLTFLRNLARNNNREWFNANKEVYLQAQTDIISFMEQLIEAYGKSEPVVEQDPKKALFRIYRDTRFSKDKTPYKTHFSGLIRRAPGKLLMYCRITPGGFSEVGTGVWRPSPEVLKAVRQEIDYNGATLQKIISRKSFVDTFGKLHGDKVLTTPKGYTKENPFIDLIRHKSLYISHRFTDDEVLDKHFVKNVVGVLKKAHDFMAFLDAPVTEAQS